MKKYRIGVDARLLSERLTGIGRYNHEILRRLVSMGHKWFLYSHRPIIIGEWNLNNVHQRTTDISNKYLRMLWAQSILPFWASKDDLDLFWSPAHRLPRFLPDKISRVVTVHDLVWKHAGETMRPLSRWLDSRLMPEAVRLANRVIVVSSSTAIDLKEEVPTSEGKIHVIPLGISMTSVSASGEILASLGATKPFFLFVGTIEPRKNLLRLLEAYARLSNHLKCSAALVIAGGAGWGGIDVVKMVEKLGLQDYVLILGYVSEEQLSVLYEHALFLAMPSLYEGFGLPLIETMARGHPVLTSNCSSMPEVAGNAGVFVDPNDVSSIEIGLLKLIADKDFRKALARNAISSANRFSWDIAAAATLKVFDEVIVSRK